MRGWVFKWVLIEESEADGSIGLTVLIVFVEIELNGLIFIGVDELWMLLLSGDDKVRLLSGGDKVHFLVYNNHFGKLINTLYLLLYCIEWTMNWIDSYD